MTWPLAAVIIAETASLTWIISLIIDRYEPRFAREAEDDE